MSYIPLQMSTKAMIMQMLFMLVPPQFVQKTKPMHADKQMPSKWDEAPQILPQRIMR